MKRFIQAVLILCLSANWAYSQKSKVKIAYNFYKEPYNQFDKAKEAIDEALQDEQTKSNVDAWFYRGLIYSALYSSEKFKSLCEHCLETAYDSYKKALEIDPTNEWADQINTLRIPQIRQQIFLEGVEFYKKTHYKAALSSFEYVLKMTPGDTSVILNCAYSAENAGDAAKAKSYYTQLAAMRFNEDHVYVALSNLYLQEKDTVMALRTIRDGRKIFPDTLSLMLSEINILLATNMSQEAIGALETAIQKDPLNSTLYLALGNTYDQLAHPKNASGEELPRPVGYAETITKAENTYKKGLDSSPSNFELNFNLGALYFNEAAEMENEANALKSTVEFNKAKAAFALKYKEAEPYLEKAQELNPEDRGTLNSLKLLYFRTNETEKYNAVKAKLDSMK